MPGPERSQSRGRVEGLEFSFGAGLGHRLTHGLGELAQRQAGVFHLAAPKPIIKLTTHDAGSLGCDMGKNTRPDVGRDCQLLFSCRWQTAGLHDR